MVPGEEIRAIVDYDLFGNNIRDQIGVYVKTNKRSGKHLIFYPQFEEWAELVTAQLEVIDDSFVTETNRDFINSLAKLK